MLSPLALAGASATLAVGGYHYAALWPGSRFFGKALVAGSDPAEVALTYDDGPNDPYTGQLLDVLARYRIRATFFLIAKYVREKPAVARAIRDAGHTIGSHSVTHPKLMYCSGRRIRQELTVAKATLEDTLGQPVRYFRPPFGSRRPEVFHILRELDQTPVLWNVAGRDWSAHSAAEIEERLERGITRNQRRHRGSNILLHDGGHLRMGTDRRRTVTATANLLAVAPRSGMRFITVDRWDPTTADAS